MSAIEIIFYALAAYIIYTYVKRYLLLRKLTNYTPDEVKSRLREGNNSVLLDVRTKSEREADHIKGSIHIPLAELKNKLKDLEKHKNREIICYCRSGNRSLTAAAILDKNGFQSANMKGGIAGWNSGK